ncbi:MAG: hypothetical protein ACFFCS_23370 [Candidatus Hodarchaeota archaeon]
MTDYYKIAYIGAGSHRFSMGLFRNIIAAAQKGLDGKPVHAALVDVDAKVLNYTSKILDHMGKNAGVDLKVTSHTNQREALEGAQFLYKSISVGGQAAEWYDNYVSHKMGIPQNTGDTVGPGGFFRGLRCFAPVTSLAKDMAELCPDAVLLNYTNPQATIVKAARRVKKDLQFLGLCHELFGGMNAVQMFNNFLCEDFPLVQDWNKDLDFTYVGVNHFTWLLTVLNDGHDLYQEMRNKWETAYKDSIGGRKFNWYLLGQHDYFPYPGSRHVAEFMPEYYNYFNHKGSPGNFGIVNLRDVKSLGLSHRYAIHRFSALSREFSMEKLPKPTTHGEHALQMTADFINSEASHHHVVNLPNFNNELCSNLPEGAILEVPGYFKDGKMCGLKIGTIPNEIADLVRVHCEVQNYVVDAAEKGDPDILLKGLLLDPMCTLIEDEERIEALRDHLLFYQQEWLPTFKEVIPKEEDLKNSKYYVSKKDIATQSDAYNVKYPIRDEIKKKCLPPF